MPFYEYKAINKEQSCDLCSETFEVIQSMSEDTLTECSECKSPIKKLFSLGSVAVAGREANQYKDVKSARYWRDKNGVRHPVTQADGYTGSATVTRQTATANEIKGRKKKDRKQGSKDRMKVQKDRADTFNRRQLEK